MANKTLKALEKPFKKGQLLQHIDGGFYRYQETVYSAEDTSQKVVYKHVYPFTVAKWERELNEFISKFTPIEEEVLTQAKKLGKKATQEQISLNKKTRQSLKNSV
jgi:hypothetical protein